MFSDDLWNLVLLHKACKFSKSNRIVQEPEIQKLESRNLRLIEILESEDIMDKHYQELKVSIEKNLVRKFWIGFKG
jgi:hypothetical protein